MPLYEYRCNSCGNRYEKIQKVDEQPDTVCPKCGGEVERPLSAPAFQFKGSGWYVTDYAKSGGSKSGGASSESSSSTESKPASTESKPTSSGSSSTTSGGTSSSSTPAS